MVFNAILCKQLPIMNGFYPHNTLVKYGSINATIHVLKVKHVLKCLTFDRKDGLVDKTLNWDSGKLSSVFGSGRLPA